MSQPLLNLLVVSIAIAFFFGLAWHDYESADWISSSW
jgi:hypothetical protein